MAEAASGGRRSPVYGSGPRVRDRTRPSASAPIRVLPYVSEVPVLSARAGAPQLRRAWWTNAWASEPQCAGKGDRGIVGPGSATFVRERAGVSRLIRTASLPRRDRRRTGRAHPV